MLDTEPVIPEAPTSFISTLFLSYVEPSAIKS